MIHQAGSTRIDAKLELGRPAMLDDIGREVRDLRVIIAHCGLPWVDEALFLLTKHPNFFTDYPGFLYDPAALREKLMTVNDEADALRMEPIAQEKLDGIMGDNFARLLGLIEA